MNATNDPSATLAQYYLPDEVLRSLRISRSTLERKMRAGEIPGAVQIGRLWRIERAVFDRWARSGFRPMLTSVECR